jgi:hypothetical protein
MHVYHFLNGSDVLSKNTLMLSCFSKWWPFSMDEKLGYSQEKAFDEAFVNVG